MQRRPHFEKARQSTRCRERKAMPREYDPRRYGPIAISSRAPVSSRSVSAAPAGEVRREGQLVFSTSPLRGGRLSSPRQRQRRVGVGGECSWPSRSGIPKWQVASRGLRSFAEEAAVSHGHRESRRTAALKGGTRGERAYRQLHTRRAPFKDINTTASTCLESTRDRAGAAAATSGSSDAAAAADTSHESRGRARRRSLSWHCREKLGGDLQQRQQPPATTPTYSSSAFCPSPSAFGSYNNANMLIDNSGRINDGGCSCCTTPRQQFFCCESMLRSTSCGSSVSSGNEAAGEREGRTRREARGRRRGRSAGEPGGRERGSGGAGRGGSIDAEELFRRKNKMASFNVTYGRWAESYDRGMARRASLERRERLEIERENDLRRQRAEEEFQKWMRSHGRRSTSSSGGTVAAAAAAAAAATTPAAAPALGARSSYHERASSASPRRRRRRLTQIRKEAWTDGERDKGVGGSGGTPRSPSSRHSPFACSEESAPFSSAGGRGDEGGVRVGGSGSGRCGGDEEEEEEKKRRREEEEQRRRRDKADRAFREWLGRKKREAQADREVQRRKEETLEKLRVLEASRRWKKRPVVCAYTYGAKVGAREWRDREEGVHTQAEGGEGQQPEEQEAGRVASIGGGMGKEREEEGEKEEEEEEEEEEEKEEKGRENGVDL